MIDRIEKILEFWFGTFPDAWTADTSKQDMWFRNGAAYDAEIFQTFGADYFKAVAGELDHWADTPRGRLALIILYDQFSRHIHRGTAEQFTHDPKAQELCLEGIGMGHDQELHPVERTFYYIPLQHAENLERQQLSLQAFGGLVYDVPESHRQPFMETLMWAEKHYTVIERFGRFPELNEMLGRESSAEEQAFLAEGEYQFL